MQSIWEKESFYAPCDVLIVGGGLSGLWCAYHLKKRKPKLSITIVDSGAIPTGASTRNAGFACFGSATELIDDAQKMGKEEMLELVEMRFHGLQKVQKLFSKKQINFELAGGYELIASSDNDAISKLEEDINWLNKALKKITGVTKTFEFADNKLSKFGFENVNHLIENKLEGYLHSGRLCLALLQNVQWMGVTVLPGLKVQAYERIGSKIAATCEHNIELTASKLLLCTNAFTKSLVPDIDIAPARGQILLTSPIDGLKFKGCFHFDEGFYYFRNLGNRVLLGGARNKAFQEETTTDMIITDLIQQELEKFLQAYILPGIKYEITDRWSGIMAMGSKKKPVVKELSPNVFCAVRMSGMGVALTPVVGEQVSKMMA